MKLLSPDIPLESELPVIKAESILSGRYVPGLIVLCLIILTSVSVQGAEDDFRVLRDFSQGPQGWRYHSSSGGGVPELKTTDGKKCISVPASFPDPVQLYKQRRSRGILGPIRIVRAEVHVPRGSENVEISFFAKDRDGHWFYALPRKPLQSGMMFLRGPVMCFRTVISAYGGIPRPIWPAWSEYRYIRGHTTEER